MTALSLSPNAPQNLLKYSVVGKYLTDTGTAFVQHVAILREDTQLSYALSNALVWHMGPPLVAGQISANAAQEEPVCTVHLAGFLQLDVQDIDGIETWLADVDKENRPVDVFLQYVVHPPVDWVRAENGTRLYRR